MNHPLEGLTGMPYRHAAELVDLVSLLRVRDLLRDVGGRSVRSDSIRRLGSGCGS